MGWGIAALVGSQLLSSFLGAKSAKQASAVAAGPQYEALRIQEEQMRKVETMTQPYREAGEVGLGEFQSRVMAGPGEFKESEGYQFTLSEGLKAIERSAAARHQQLSGATLKDLSKYAMGMASTEYDTFLNRYYASLSPFQSLATMGQQAVGQFGGLGQANVATQSQTLSNIGGTQAAGILGQNQAWQTGIQNVLNMGGYYLGAKAGSQPVGISGWPT